MKKIVRRIKLIYKKIDFGNFKTQIGISVLVGLLFGLIMGYQTYNVSYFPGAPFKNIDVPKGYYEKNNDKEWFIKTYNFNYTAAVTVTLATMSLFLIFKQEHNSK